MDRDNSRSFIIMLKKYMTPFLSSNSETTFNKDLNKLVHGNYG